jgi:NADH:ubiquinone oxidoreductase subunit K
MFPEEVYFYPYSNVVLLVSLICGCIGIFNLLRDREYLDALLSLLLYLIPPVIIFILIPTATHHITRTIPSFSVHPEIIRFGIMLILGPIILVWIMWLLFGGFALIEKEIKLRQVLREHFTHQSLLKKLFGLSGVVAATVVIEYSYFLWQVQKRIDSLLYGIFFILAMMAYMYSIKYILTSKVT